MRQRLLGFIGAVGVAILIGIAFLIVRVIA